MVLLWPLWEINMHADNLAEDIWTRYTGPKHVRNQKRYDGFKGILGLQLATQTPRYSQCAKPASFAAVIYHVYAKFHYAIWYVRNLCIIRVSYAYKLAFTLIIHWHHWHSVLMSCVLYVKNFMLCILTKTIHSLHSIDLYITPNYLINQDKLFDIMTYFWFHDKHLAHFWHHDKSFDAMTNFLTRWRLVDVMANFLK